MRVHARRQPHRTRRDAPDATHVRLTVSDTGQGIPDAELPRIFERFYRVDKARSRDSGGTGLGLSIVRHLVELHGGMVSAANRPDGGATFTITLPPHVAAGLCPAVSALSLTQVGRGVPPRRHSQRRGRLP